MENRCKDYLITLTTDDEVIELALVKGKGVAFHMMTYFDDVYKKEGKVEMVELKRRKLKTTKRAEAFYGKEMI